MEYWSRMKNIVRKLISKLSHLNPISTKEFGFMEEWLQIYYSPKSSHKSINNRYFKFYLWFSLFMTFRSCIVFKFSKYNVIGSPLSVCLGSWTVTVGGKLVGYFEFVALMWSLHSLSFYFTIINRKKESFKWIEVFGALHGYIEPQSIGIDHQIMIK